MRKERVSNQVHVSPFIDTFLPILNFPGVFGQALSYSRDSNSSTISPSRLARISSGQYIIHGWTKLTGRNLDYARNSIRMYCKYMPLPHGERHV